MHGMRKIAIVVSLVTIAACAHTGDHPDSASSVSEQWYGRYSFCGESKNVFNLGQLTTTPTEFGSYVWLERNFFIYGRTGVLVSSISVSSAEGRVVDLSAGTPAIAINHRSDRTKEFRSPNYRYPTDDPLEWCFVEGKEILVCAEWAGNGNALYLTPKPGENLYSPALEPNGVLGPAPIIEETPVNLGFYFLREDGLEFTEWGPRTIQKRTQHVDGVVQTVRETQSWIPYVPNNKNFEFQNGDKFRVQVVSENKTSSRFSAPTEIYVEREQTSWPLLPYCGNVDTRNFGDE